MTSFSSGSSSGPKFSSSEAHVADQTAKERTSYIKNKEGDAVGNNYIAPKGDFSTFLGYKPPTPGELSGKTPVAGHRVLEVALQKTFNEIGEGAAERGNTYRNMYVANGRFANEPGREKEMIKDGFDSIRAGAEYNSTQRPSTTGASASGTMPSAGAPPGGAMKLGAGSAMKQYLNKVEASQNKSHNDNVRYLEMQYKFQEISKQDGVISNLMKTRHDAVSRTIRGGQ
jgi:hypothetical protein